MAILNQKRILNLIPKVSAPVTIHVSQGDVGTDIEFTLVKGDEVFVNPGNVSASVHGVREDGANFGPFTCTLSGSKVTFPLHSEMTAVKGSALAEIVLVDNGGNKVGSANFGILVEQSVFPLGVTYDNDMSVYESILAYAQTIPAQVQGEIADLENNVSSLNGALAQEVANRNAAIANASSGLQANIDSEANARATENAALSARMDSFTSLSEESTTGDGELIDIRTGYDGKTYLNAGSAVRGQIENVLAKDNYKENAFGLWREPSNVYKSSTGKLYRVDNKTEQNQTNGCYQILSGLTAGMGLLLSGYSWSAPTQFPFYAFYDSSDNLLSRFGGAGVGYENVLVIVPANATKIVVNGDKASNLYYPASIKTFTRDDLISALNEICNNFQSAIVWDDISGISQSESSGVVNFLDGTTSQSAKHLTIDVSSIQGEIVGISGCSHTISSSYKFSLAGAYDNNGQLIETYGDTSNTEYKYFSIRIPINAVTLIINGNTSGELSIKKASTEKFTSEIYQKALDSYNYFIADEMDDNSHLFVPVEPSYVEGGIMNFSNGETYGSKYGKKYEVSEGDTVRINGKTSTVQRGYNYNIYGFYDASMNLIEASQYPSAQTVYENIIVTVPTGAVYCYVNGTVNYNSSLYIITKPNIKTYIDSNTYKGSWLYGKKVGVIGTSVAFGQNATTSYMYEAAKRLGFELKMFAVPGLAIETQLDGSPKTYGSFTLSKAEYTAAGITIPQNPITPYVPGGSYNDYYRTYENVFVEDNEDIDLWIYAVIPNNSNFVNTDWEAFNKSSWKYNDDSAFSTHRKTFIGALLFIMDQMYQLNNNARMLLVIDSNFSYDDGKSCFELLQNQWNMPIIDLWGNINTSPKSLNKLKSESGTNNHPSTFAHEIMGVMISSELNRFA